MMWDVGADQSLGLPAYGTPGAAGADLKANFLDRPIVNEYLEILWSCIHSIWPDLERKEYKAKNFITCDVDLPFNPSLFKNWV